MTITSVSTVSPYFDEVREHGLSTPRYSDVKYFHHVIAEEWEALYEISHLSRPDIAVIYYEDHSIDYGSMVKKFPVRVISTVRIMNEERLVELGGFPNTFEEVKKELLYIS